MDSKAPGSDESQAADSSAEPLARLRAELETARQELRAHAQEAAALRAANQELVVAGREKDEFLAMVGHELRNPLAPISTVLQLLRLRGETALREERAVLERHFAQLVLVVEDLLDAARITGGRMVLKKQRLELGEIVARAIELTAPMLERLRHRLTIDVDASGLVLEADAQRLTQVITNLLTNAAKLTEAGGEVALVGAREGGEVVLRVRFERFVQGPLSTNRSVGALGLGFAVLERIIGLHGGAVSLELDGRGQGAEFRIALPAGPARALALVPAPEPELEAVSKVVQDKRLRILLVDDNEDTADMLSYLLEELGYSTRVAHEAASALQMAADEPPDVALLDLSLPVMDGYQLAARLRQQPGLEALKLIAVTGYGQDSHRQRTAAAGFHAHLVKPIEPRQLVDTINGLIGNQQD